jgi:hypothetical protein
MWFFNKNPDRKPLSVIIEHIGVMIPCLIIVCISFVFTPSDLENKNGMAKIIPQCMFKKLTGLPCPTCGMSRAFCSVSRGRVDDAIHYNLFVIIVYPLVIAGILIPLISLLHYWVTLKEPD